MNKKVAIAKLKFINDNVVPLVAILIAGLALFRDCGQDKGSRKIQYQLNALSLQPRLRIADKSYMPAVIADSLKLQYSGKSMTSVGKTPFLDLFARLTLDYALAVTNVGNSLAKMVAIFSIDSSSASDVIRDLAFTARLDTTNVCAFKDYSTIELLPGASDTINMEISRPLRDWPGQEFTVHILLLYENEMHQFFDTYYWLHYRFQDIALPIPDKGQRLDVVTSDIFTRAIVMLQQKHSFNTYDQTKAEKMDQRLRSLQRVFKKGKTSKGQG